MRSFNVEPNSKILSLKFKQTIDQKQALQTLIMIDEQWNEVAVTRD